MGGQQRQRQWLPAQHLGPHIGAAAGDRITGQRRHHDPIVVVQFAVQLAERPAGVPGENPDTLDQRPDPLRGGIQIHQHHPAVDPPYTGHAVDGGAHPHSAQAQRGIAFDRATHEQRARLRADLAPLRQHIVHGGFAGPVQHHTQGSGVVVLDDVDDRPAERRLGQIGRGNK